MSQPATPQQEPIWRALALLTLSAFLFATMGVCIRFASHTVNNETIVFMRNLTGTMILLPLVLVHGVAIFKTSVFGQHLWRAIVGLAAMYGFFYAIANLPLSSAMVFTYSSPIFVPVIAWLFLKEVITTRMMLAAILGLCGVLLVSRPDIAGQTTIALVGVGASFLAAMAFVTVRGLSRTEPATRIVFYFSWISTLVSAIPMIWAWRPLTSTEFAWVIGAGILATLSQLAMSKAYSLAPAGKIAPAAYLAIGFAGIWAWLIWGELPDLSAVVGVSVIILATLICLDSPLWQRILQLKRTASGG